MNMENGAPAPMRAHASAPLIEARGMTKRYDGFTLDGVNLRVEAGRVVGLVGQNGAGKSTTIKGLLGLIALDAGEVRILGALSHDLASGSAREVKERIGVVFDTVALPTHLSVAQVGRLMSRAYRTWDKTTFDALVATFKLDTDKAVKDLSRGMGMKLSLACALAHHPQVLILDEATAGLDPMARDEVLDILRDFVAVEDTCGNPCHAILMSSHITSDLEKIADEVVCIDAGRIVFSAPKDEVTDTMGVAHCRASELDGVLACAVGEGLRVLRRAYGVDVLVADRFAFARVCPEVPCDRMTIDDYMTFMLKGEVVPAPAMHAKGGER